MKPRQNLKTIVAGLLAALMLLPALLTGGAPQRGALAAGERVAYVYLSDTATRDKFNTMLTGKGITVDAYDEVQAVTANFIPDQTIIIADDAGATGSIPLAVILNIQNSGKPVVGIGLGGLVFFN